ncbi:MULTISPECIES: ABC transporter substrate-binding protein [unclassified Microbacterium]|uniref:ABC transporter substrate-binding protein n=1 Tax=unclassified Microbacterium TaxID=2609290 RepID=UPI000F54D06A|nr:MULTISPECIES: ABC transporter substrate-binding protein [unclassified Microbacterium]AZC14485.1 ABC transporter substrate-binding protein [Microbacterium sp. ABRD28]TQK20171.1 peptide/nickel transport system substrate-binding protein [Microbacterium sp. SLBN-154]
MRLRTSLGAAGIITALALTGCAGGGSDTGSAESGAALTIAKPDGAITTESHNPFLGDSSASKYGYAKVIFEPMALVNPTGDLGTTPWLAESVEWNDDYTQLTVVPRSGVTWSDGTPFTGEDIVFTFDQFLDGRLADTSGLKYEGATVDGDAITLTFADSKFVSQARVLHTPIVPKHIWENIDDPNTDPLTGEGLAVGTGPYVLDNWSTESVTLTANPDYWGGELAVPALNYVSYGDNAALTTALVSGEADWAQAFIPQIQESYLAADEDNHYLVSPTAGSGTLFMNLQAEPFDDPALREALAWTIDRQAYVDIAREGASEAVWSVTGLGNLLENEVLPEFADQEYAVDVDKARDILSEAGYTWEDDTLIDPDGEAVSFSISVPAGWSDWNTEQALLAEELDAALGIEVQVDQPDWGGWDAARQEGTFQAIIHWLEDTGNAYGLYTSTMDPKWIVDDRAQFNFGRFEDPAVTEALNTYANTASEDERQAALETMQRAFVENVPAIPLGSHPLLGQYNTRSYVGFPTDDDQYASADPTQPGIVQILTKLQPAG